MSKPQAEPRQYQQFVGGHFVDAASGATLSIENPANGDVIARVPASAAEDVERAVGSAATAFESWRDTTPQERSLAMLRVADALETRAQEFGRLESLNAGKPVRAAIDEMATCVDVFRFFAGAARLLEGKAVGEYLRGHTSMVRREPPADSSGRCAIRSDNDPCRQFLPAGGT